MWVTHSIIIAVVADAGKASSTLNMADRRTVGEASLMLHVEWHGRAEGEVVGAGGGNALNA